MSLTCWTTLPRLRGSPHPQPRPPGVCGCLSPKRGLAGQSGSCLAGRGARKLEGARGHSSVLAWRITRMGEPDGLPSMGSHRVGEGERVLALESREGTRASRRVEEGLSRSLSGGGVPTLQGPCGRSPKRRGSLRCLPPLKVRPSSVAPDPAESRGAPPPPQCLGAVMADSLGSCAL